MQQLLVTAMIKLTIISLCLSLGGTVAYAERKAVKEGKRIPWIKPEPVVIKKEEVKVEPEAVETKQLTRKKNKSCSLKDDDIYEQAFDKLMKGEYQSSIEAYKFFINNFPYSPNIGDANYWMAEANYLSENYQQAINQYKYVTKHFSNNMNVRYAELKIAQAYNHMQKWSEAKKAFDNVISNNPNTIITKQARAELSLMRKKGHI